MSSQSMLSFDGINNCSTMVDTLRLKGSTLAVAIVLLGMFSLLLWSAGLACLLRYRHHRAVRAASVELSVCLLVASLLRVPLVFSLALDASALNCMLRVVLTNLSTELTFTAIALKVTVRKPNSTDLSWRVDNYYTEFEYILYSKIAQNMFH